MAFQIPKRHLQQKTVLAIVVLFIATAGTVLLLRSSASTPSTHAQPEQGQLTAGTATINDSGASGGQAIRFSTAPAIPAPTTPDGFTKMFADKNDQTWSGGDQNTSYLAPNGKVYWLAGDTMVSNGVAADGSYPSTGTAMLSNRILLQQGGSLVNAMANNGIGVPDPSTRTTANNERYWPQGLFAANNKLYVLCQRVTSDSTVNTFALVGTEMATYTIATDGKLTFTGMKPTPATGIKDGIGAAYIQWAGDGIVTDGYAYLYGYTKAATNPYVPIYSYAARVPVAQVETPTAWQFYKKSTGQWVSSTAQLSTDATNQPDSVLPTQLSSIRKIGNKFVAVHKPFNNFGTPVYAEIANTPYGPFTQKHLFDSPAGTWNSRQYVTYIPTLHPEQALAGGNAGQVLVSINWNGVDFYADLLKNADLYKPRFHSFSMP